jgi:hypothetical protein
MTHLVLKVMPWKLAVCKLPLNARLPRVKGFFCMTKADGEYTLVCDSKFVPPDAIAESGWTAFRVEGKLGFGLTGILSSIASPLADAKIGIFAISTFDTDYVLVKQEKLEAAIATLGKTFEVRR